MSQKKRVPDPYRESPEAKQKLQASVDAANLLLVFAIGERLGLVEAGHVNVSACEAALLKGDLEGVHPRTPGPARA